MRGMKKGHVLFLVWLGLYWIGLDIGLNLSHHLHHHHHEHSVFVFVLTITDTNRNTNTQGQTDERGFSFTGVKDGK